MRASSSHVLRVTIWALTAGMAVVAVSTAHGDPTLPPRALLRIGTNDLRTSGAIPRLHSRPTAGSLPLPTRSRTIRAS